MEALSRGFELSLARTSSSWPTTGKRACYPCTISTSTVKTGPTSTRAAFLSSTTSDTRRGHNYPGSGLSEKQQSHGRAAALCRDMSGHHAKVSCGASIGLGPGPWLCLFASAGQVPPQQVPTGRLPRLAARGRKKQGRSLPGKPEKPRSRQQAEAGCCQQSSQCFILHICRGAHLAATAFRALSLLTVNHVPFDNRKCGRVPFQELN